MIERNWPIIRALLNMYWWYVRSPWNGTTNPQWIEHKKGRLHIQIHGAKRKKHIYRYINRCIVSIHIHISMHVFEQKNGRYNLNKPPIFAGRHKLFTVKLVMVGSCGSPVNWVEPTNNSKPITRGTTHSFVGLSLQNQYSNLSGWNHYHLANRWLQDQFYNLILWLFEWTLRKAERYGWRLVTWVKIKEPYLIGYMGKEMVDWTSQPFHKTSTLKAHTSIAELPYFVPEAGLLLLSEHAGPSSPPLVIGEIASFLPTYPPKIG